MEIRQLTPLDAEEYLNIRLEALKNNPSSFASSFEESKHQTADKFKERFSTSAHSFTFGVFEKSELIGIGTLIRESLIKLNHRANIVAMYIKSEHRKKGIGKALLLHLVNKAKKLNGVEQINISVVTLNAPARKLYSSCGFEVFGIEKRALKHDNIYYDEEYMVLFLI